MDRRSGYGRAEDGAQTVEFAILAPALVFLVFGIIYALLAFSAQASMAHAASRAVRYASLPVDPVSGQYPSPSQVADTFYDSTPFFASDACTTLVSGATGSNSPVTLSVECFFPNPLGAALGDLGALLGGRETGGGGDLVMTSTASSRRE